MHCFRPLLCLFIQFFALARPVALPTMTCGWESILLVNWVTM